MNFFEALSYILIYILIPIAVIFVLIWLTLLLIELKDTVKKYNKIADELDSRIKLLDGPINTILMLKDSIEATVNNVNNALVALNNIPSFITNIFKKKNK